MQLSTASRVAGGEKLPFWLGWWLANDWSDVRWRLAVHRFRRPPHPAFVWNGPEDSPHEQSLAAKDRKSEVPPDREAAMSRLLKLGELAAGTVEAAVEQGDVRVAVLVLKELGLLSEKAIEIGSCDSKKLNILAQKQAQTDALMALL